MKKQLLFRLVFSGLFAALIFALTAILPFPLPGNGYANLGDCFVILAGVILGPVYGSAAAAVGSMLSDLFLGYAVYAPATFVIKGLMALVACFIAGHISKARTGIAILRCSVAAIAAELVMILGYFLFEIVLYGFATALADTVGNGIQGIVGAVSAIAICSVLTGTKLMSKIVPPISGNRS